MTVTLNIAGIVFFLDIPEALFLPIASHFSFFRVDVPGPPETQFHVEVMENIHFEHGCRDTVKFHAVSPSVFVYGCPAFVLTVDMEVCSGRLRISKSIADPSAEIFSAFKWFFVFMVIARKGIPLHSSSVIIHEKAYLFSGASGKGKSTISALLTTNLSGCLRGSDELNVVFPSEGALYMHSTPFHSSNGQGLVRERVPLDAVFFIEHCSSNSIEYVRRADAFRHVLRNVYHIPANREVMNLLADSVCLFSEFPIFYTFFFINQPSVAECFSKFRSEINAY